MSRPGSLLRLGLFVAAGSALVASVAIAQTAPPTGPCPNGSGMMGPNMMGPNTMGMMGPMMGSNMMGPMMGWSSQPQANLNLSVDDVRGSVERSIAMMGNPRLKPGKVVATNADTITAEIVTVDKDVFVQRFAVNRHTGYWQQLP